MSRLNIVVAGFIRGIELLLDRQAIVPNCVFEICDEYYSIKVWLQNNTHKVIIGYTLHSNTATPRFQLEKNLRSELFCYIPNISSIIAGFKDVQNKSIIANKSYDAFFGVSTFGYSAAFTYITLKLFRSDHTENNYITFEAKNGFCHNRKCVDEFLFCNEHGIIYEHQSELYQLDLVNINLQTKEFDFTIREGSQIQYALWQKEKQYFYKYFLTMRYMHDHDMLFAVQCPITDRNHKRLISQTSTDPESNTCTNNAKCGVYNFAQDQWKMCSPFEYDTNKYKSAFQCKIAKNRYEYQKIYALTNGETVSYHFGKDKWTTLLDKYDSDMILAAKHKRISLWLDDPNTLYYIGYPNIKVLDVRDNKKAWKKCDMLLKQLKCNAFM